MDSPTVDQARPGGAVPRPPVTATGPSGAVPGPADGSDPGAPGTGRRLLPWAVASLAYLGLSLFLFWGTWGTHPASTTTCGCGDSALFLWFLEWPAHALTHGLNPLYSTAMSYPGGVNLLANTSELAIGVVLAPVTWIFGPVATFNVALLLAPPLSALSAFALLRRWVAWSPAAFAGGLLYGFSAFVLVALTDGHLMVGMAPIPPLVALCLDELLVRQRRRPVGVGLVLALLLVVQFFLGTELLVIIVLGAAIGIVLLVAGMSRRAEEIRRRFHHAAVGLATAGGAAAVALAYPVWFTLAGPAHTSGAVWPTLALSREGAALRDFVVPAAVSASFTTFAHRVGGYQGPTLSGQYIGWGVFAVGVAGLVVWRRDRRLWLFAGTAVATGVLALGSPAYARWLPWGVAGRLPELENIIPSRFLVVTYLSLAVLVALVVDHVHTAVLDARTAPARPHTAARQRGASRRWVAAVAAAAVAAVAIVPVGTYLARSAPLTTQPVVLPTWFETVAPHLGPHQVVLAYPLSNQTIESAMAWQAVGGMTYSMVGGGGPGAVPQRAGRERPGLTLLGASSFSFTGQQFATDDAATARAALDAWGVTVAVVPDEPGLRPYDRVTSVPYAVAFLTAAIGQPPVRQAGAWVWRDVDRAGPALTVPVPAFAACVAGDPLGPSRTDVAATARVARCVASAGTAR